MNTNGLEKERSQEIEWEIRQRKRKRLYPVIYGEFSEYYLEVTGSNPVLTTN